jgi:hypothetical protein
MAYDRSPPRDRYGRDPDSRRTESRWQDDRDDDWSRRGRSDRHDERGFFERAGDEVASWFGDDEAERRRREDHMRDGGNRGSRAYGRERSDFARGPYRPVTGDYGRGDYSRGERSEQFYAASGIPRGGFGPEDPTRSDDGDYRSGRVTATYGRDQHRRGATNAFGGSRDFDPHYQNWRDRQMDELDRDYHDYRQENQSRFENDFSNWRQKRTAKRGLLGTISEHMEVVGNDDQHVGTVDKVARDRLILTKSDPESGGAHHSLSCSDIDRVEGDRVILDCSAEQAKSRWRDESRSRALFERDDQGEMGPRILDRSFEGTYR